MRPAARPRVYFFVGPSVSPAELRAVCSAIEGEVSVVPPIEQGDLLRLLPDLPDVIGIVDGSFFQVPSVLHKEILLAMERGARVLGAASLGALRAAELDVFGMEGIGAIYRLYKRGVIDGDDEVAVVHAGPDDGFRPLTESLVNLRHNLRRARARGIVSARTAATVVAFGKRLHFAERTYQAVLDGAAPGAVPAEERAALQRFLREEAVDLKREDALALVRAVAERTSGGRPWPPASPVTAYRTSYFHRYLREYVGQPAAGQHVPDTLVLSFQQLLCPSFQSLQRRVALRCLALDEARERGLADEDPETLIARFRRGRKLRSEEAFETWLRERYLSREELEVALGERRLERRLLALYSARHPESRGRAALFRRVMADVGARQGMSKRALTRPLLMWSGLPWDGPLLREMKLRGAFRPALELAGRIVAANAELEARNPRFSLSRLKRGRIESWCAARWGVPESQLKEETLDRGFANDQEFDEAARRAYAWERSVRSSAVGDLHTPEAAHCSGSSELS